MPPNSMNIQSFPTGNYDILVMFMHAISRIILIRLEGRINAIDVLISKMNNALLNRAEC